LHGEDIQEIRERTGSAGVLAERGTVEEVSVDEAYLSDLVARVGQVGPLNVTCDPGNGAASILGPRFLRAIGCRVDAIFAEPDGRFPNHLPDPTVPELVRALAERVRSTRADIGIGFDGDADRVGAVDEQGRLLFGDQTLARWGGKKLSSLVDALPQSRYFATPEIRLGCTDAAKFAIVDAVREHYRAQHEVLDVDGARVQFGDGWGLIRASNTQPVLV